MRNACDIGLTFVMTDATDHKQKASIKKLATLTQSKLGKEVTERTTHLIVCGSENVLASRTYKYLAALLHGVWIVDYSWVKACLRYGACWKGSDLKK